MKVCIVGGGAAGLYTAKKLIERNHIVHIFDKSDTLFGKLLTHFLPNKTKNSYISTFDSLIKHPNFLFTQQNISSLKSFNNFYDAFVVAIGSIPRTLSLPGSENLISADRVIKWYNGTKKGLELGKNVAIIGMGDVSFDIIQYLFAYTDVTQISVLSRKSISEATFSNNQLRLALENAKCKVNCDTTEAKSGAIRRRLSLINDNMINENALEMYFGKKLNFIFNAATNKVELKNGKMRLFYNNEYLDADSVLTSTGYKPVDTKELVNGIKKAVFYVGSCVSPKNNMASIKAEAEIIADKIESLNNSSWPSRIVNYVKNITNIVKS